jgi:dihydroneopterin aldolase
MTQLLISVKNVAEALLALEAGTDIIDLKDPNIGALGALDMAISANIVQLIGGATIVSATVGEQHTCLNELITEIKARAEIGADIIKIAVSRFFYEADFLIEISKLTNAGIKIVAVFFADENIDYDLLEMLQKAGFYGAMLDTKNKLHGLLALQSKSNLHSFTHLCHQHQLESGLAGSLKPQHVETLCEINPKYIGFRGGVCENDIRKADLSGAKVIEIKNMLHQHNKINDKAHLSMGLALLS